MDSKLSDPMNKQNLLNFLLSWVFVFKDSVLNYIYFKLNYIFIFT
jgi:hypothetical protein